MTGKPVTAPEDATLQELHALVTSAEDGRVAILRGDEHVGVVARTDLLRALEGVEPALARRRGEPRGRARGASSACARSSRP